MKRKVTCITLVMALLAISGTAIGADARTDGAKNTAPHLSSTGVTGGWTDFTTDIPKETLSLFNKALAGLAGVSYKPLALSSQVVAGINYQFFCNSKTVYPGAPNRAVIVHIYAPLTGEAHVSSIQPVTQ